MRKLGGWRSDLRQLTLVVATLGVVMGMTAGVLRGLDLLARSLQGEPAGVKRYRSIEEAEKKLAARLLLPAYFPETLQWPTFAIRFSGRPSPAVALSFRGSEGSSQRLFVFQTLKDAGSFPQALLPPGPLLHSTAVPLDATEGRLSRIMGEDGEIWHEVAWEREGRRMALRFKGPVEELLRMARSMRRGRS